MIELNGDVTDAIADLGAKLRWARWRCRILAVLLLVAIVAVAAAVVNAPRPDDRRIDVEFLRETTVDGMRAQCEWMGGELIFFSSQDQAWTCEDVDQ